MYNGYECGRYKARVSHKLLERYLRVCCRYPDTLNMIFVRFMLGMKYNVHYVGLHYVRDIIDA